MERKVLSCLAIEDDVVDIRILEEVIAEGDGSIVIGVCRSIKEAEAALARGGYDVILLDMFLPDAVGLEGLKRLLQLFPEVPIVIMTGQYSSDLAREAHTLGAEGCLPKGTYTYGELAQVLRSATETHRLKAQLQRMKIQ